MANAALMQLLDRWRGARDGDADASLVTRFLASRDQDAFAALVQRHGRLVYGTCLRILGNGNDSDDAFQAVFFVLARRAHTLKLDRSIGPWLHGVAVRVAKKLRGQSVQRRLREMSVARSERVEPAESNRDFWAIIDEELARLPLPLREAALLCDLDGQSYAQAAKSLGLAKGTITKRLAKAREELATRLTRRGITLGASALATIMATRATASVPAPLLLETTRQAIAFSVGKVADCVRAKTLAEGVMRSLKIGALRLWLVVGLLGLLLTGGGLMLAGGPRDPAEQGVEQPQPKPDAKADAAKPDAAKPDAAKARAMWKHYFTAHHETNLPVSVALSPDGKTLLIGDTNGQLTAARLPSDPPTARWQARVEGSHPAVAYSLDGKHVYATTTNGVVILDAENGKHVGRLEAPDSNAISIGVHPNNAGRVQIVFGNARGDHVMSWAELVHPGEPIAGSEVSTLAKKDAKPGDPATVPLAVDPKGRCAIMTGPRDATGKVGGIKGKNVLWAYACGDPLEDSPGNRVMIGHTATVNAAAWAREGSTAVTGDADGRVIVWDAKTMKEARRVELGGRVVAVAISDDGTHTAAYVRGKPGGQLYVWETAKPASALKPIHTQLGDFAIEPYASLTFSRAGKLLAGCLIDKKWLPYRPGTLLPGQVHVWQLAAEPKAQPAPKHLYSTPGGGPASFAIPVNNLTMLTLAEKEGGINFGDLRFGYLQGRFVLGKFAVRGMKLAADRRWLALEQHAVGNDRGIGAAGTTFDVGVYQWPPRYQATIPSCSQLLDLAPGGKVVAVVRENQIELWDTSATKKLKAAPFRHTRVDAASFSPDGKLLAISDQSELVLWRWEENAHERIDLGRRVGSLAFSPDGSLLAEGPTPGESIHVRDVATRKVVQTLTNGTKRPMNVPRIAYTQGGRVLIACDNIPAEKDTPIPHRITLWDTVTGSIAHQIALPTGVPTSIDVSPDGRYLAALLDDGAAGTRLSVWRLDGETPVADQGPTPPAAPPR
jgi:RNA polymerase sigma factor (sigma-70 family)